jgi:hypothetical protein
MTGTRHPAAVEDAIKSFSGRVVFSMTEIGPEMRQLGATVRDLGPIQPPSL